jgi:hypothetical protein
MTAKPTEARRALPLLRLRRSSFWQTAPTESFSRRVIRCAAGGGSLTVRRTTETNRWHPFSPVGATIVQLVECLTETRDRTFGRDSTTDT